MKCYLVRKIRHSSLLSDSKAAQISCYALVSCYNNKHVTVTAVLQVKVALPLCDFL